MAFQHILKISDVGREKLQNEATGSSCFWAKIEDEDENEGEDEGEDERVRPAVPRISCISSVCPIRCLTNGMQQPKLNVRFALNFAFNLI